jgi:quinol monooxygenase YgiN
MKAKPPASPKVVSSLLIPLPGKEQEFSQTLLSLQAEIKQEPGCLECVVGQDLSGDPRFVLFVVWKDLSSLEAHMESDNFRVLAGAIKVLSAPSEFRFITANTTYA